MDIRTFFGKSPAQISQDSKKPSTVTKITRNKDSKNDNKDKQKNSLAQNKEKPKKSRNDSKQKEDVEFEPVYKKKRLLKKIIISDSSDSDSGVLEESPKKPKTLFDDEDEVASEDVNNKLFITIDDENSNPSGSQTLSQEKQSPANEKKNSKSVSTWVREQLKMDAPEKLEDLEKDNCSTDNMQADIKYWCNNEKKLVDPSTNVSKDTRINVDMNSYLDLLAFPKSQKQSKSSMQNYTPTDSETSNLSTKSFKDVYESVKTTGRSDKSIDSPSKLDLSLKSPEKLLHPNETTNASPSKRLRFEENKSPRSVKSIQSPMSSRSGSSVDVSERLTKKTNVSVQKSPKRQLQTTESKDKEPMESLFGSSDSSPYVSPSKTTSKTSDTSEENSPKKRRYTKASGATTPRSRTKKEPKTQHDADLDPSNPVAGRRFVFTGELSIDRDEAVYRVKKLGGIVVSGVSGLTDYLVYGEKLEDGRAYVTGTKYKKAKDLNKNKGLNIQIINEEQFMGLINDVPKPEDKTDSLVTEKPEESAPFSEKTEVETKSVKSEPESSSAQTSAKTQQKMLFEKYRPTNLYELIGNPRLIDRLKDWLQNYDYTAGPTKGKSENFKAALLSGPPGIGKTTCARLVAESFGYYVMEFNASDQRSKNAVERITPLVTGTLTLNSFQQNTPNDLKKTLLVLDEIDGMSSGDRGGIQSIIKLIQVAKCPIILICNDRHSQKISALSSKCLDLRFNSPSIELFINRVNLICRRENIPVDENVLLELYHKSNGDMRYALNYLQFYTTTKNQEGPDGYMNKKDESYSQNIFDNCNKAFNLNKLSLRDKLNKVNEIFFSDYNIMSLMFQENYIKYNKNIAVISKLAMTYVSGDMVNNVIQKTQTYSLLPDLSCLTAIIPALELNKAGCILSERLSFPQWLGKHSTTNKNRRILGEISMNLAYKTTIYGYNLLMDGYLEIIYQNVMNNLLKENVDECVDYINELGITREMVIDGIANLRFKNQENVYSKISTKIKTQLTKKMATQLVKVVNTKRNRFTSYDSKSDNESSSEEEEDDYDPLLKKVNPNKKQARQKKK